MEQFWHPELRRVLNEIKAQYAHIITQLEEIQMSQGDIDAATSELTAIVTDVQAQVAQLGTDFTAIQAEIAALQAQGVDTSAGVVDGDGSIGFSCGFAFLHLCGSRRLLEAFVSFLGHTGARRLHVRPHKTIYGARTGGATAERIIDRLYVDAGTALDRRGLGCQHPGAVHDGGPGPGRGADHQPVG